MRKSNISKEQIIRAAAQVFFGEGFENATVDDIVKNAGIAKGSFYTYFKTRDEILTESIKYLSSERINSLKTLISVYKNPTEQIMILMNANDAMSRTNPEIFLMNYALLLSSHESIKKKVVKEFFGAYIEMFEDIIKAGIKKKEFKNSSPRIAALTLVLSHDLISILNNIEPGIFGKGNVQQELLNMLRINTHKKQ